MPELTTPPHTSRLQGRQRGSTLLESLVSMLVLTVGVLGLATVQLRTLAETQTSVRRSQAIRAIEDLAERIKANPDGFGQLRAGSYASGWDTDTASPDDGCSSHPCTPAELARSDVRSWKKHLAETLPLGGANVFTSTDGIADAADIRQLGVMVGWRANERAHVGDTSYTAAFRVSTAGIECPEDLICHLAYVQP